MHLELLHVRHLLLAVMLAHGERLLRFFLQAGRCCHLLGAHRPPPAPAHHVHAYASVRGVHGRPPHLQAPWDRCHLHDDSLASLRLLLDPACDCIQVDGLWVAGVPVGSPEFIANYIRSKALDIVQDVEKLRIMEDDPPVHYHLVKICKHTRLAFLARNLSPAQMTMPARGILGPQHVDQAVSQAILQVVGTAGNFNTWPTDVKHTRRIPRTKCT